MHKTKYSSFTATCFGIRKPSPKSAHKYILNLTNRINLHLKKSMYHTYFTEMFVQRIMEALCVLLQCHVPDMYLSGRGIQTSTAEILISIGSLCDVNSDVMWYSVQEVSYYWPE
jgi:hypothetical protein